MYSTCKTISFCLKFGLKSLICMIMNKKKLNPVNVSL